LLIQKTMADKLSDKITVIIAPPSTSGGFIGSALLGLGKPSPEPSDAVAKKSAQAGEQDAVEGAQ
jgi:hypothetical protein